MNSGKEAEDDRPVGLSLEQIDPVGGDIFASGVATSATPWIVGVANPLHSEDNAPPLTQVRLSDRAISTSAAYERGFTFAGKHYSHILDPRTGYPATGAASYSSRSRRS